LPRRALLLLSFLVLVAPAAAAGPAELMPGVEYRQETVLVGGGAAVVHVVTAPHPGGLYSLRPVLSNELVVGRETVTGMQQRLSGEATLVGVNGDLSNFEIGNPTGIYLADGILASRPVGGRSSLGIGVDGLLRVARIDFFGSIRFGDGEPFPVAQFNRPLSAEDNGLALFTPRWGGESPAAADAVDVVLSGFPGAQPNADLPAQVAEVRRGGGTPVPADGAVLQATGFWADRVLAEAVPGVPTVARLILRPWWDQVSDAIGGGPVLVRRGVPVLWAGEAFTPSQLNPRHPRTAVGQLEDGRILLVAVDGRSRVSRGMTIAELARTMARLGAVTAMALDGGGSTTVAFDGQVLNSPSDGVEHAVGDALMVRYTGAFAPLPRHDVLSPNGDGVAERQQLAYKVVRPSTVSVSLVGPDGTVAWQDECLREPGTIRVRPAPERLAVEGPWTWTVTAVDADGLESSSSRTFVVNNTLGFLRLSSPRLRVPAKRRAAVTVSVELARAARVTATVVDRDGVVVRRLHRRTAEPGEVVVTWNGRDRRGRRVESGRYEVQVAARNDIGEVTLERGIAVKQLPAKKRSKRH
jgi:hypothetical protein